MVVILQRGPWEKGRLSGELRVVAPKVFSVSLLQKNPRTHFDGNNTWDQTLFENKNAMREKKIISSPKEKKVSSHLLFPSKCVLVFFLQNFSKNTFGATTMSSPAWVLGKEETPFWRPLFLSLRNS